MPNSPLTATTANALGAQFANPADIFTLLFLVGGNVVQAALAQNAGFRAYEVPLWRTKRNSTDRLSERKPSRYKWSLRFSPPFLCFTPVAFSFGWLSYTFTTLATVWGGETLLPKSTAQCIVVEGKSGHVRSNTSWVIGRMWQDYAFWRDSGVDALLPRLQKAREREPWELVGLIVGVYRFGPFEGPTPRFVKGVGWVFALLVTLAQLGCAVIPLATEGEWGTLLVTVVGTLLAWWTAALPQWREEKFRARKAIRDSKGDLPSVVITSGNGAQHAILIVCEEGSMNLEDLATGQNEYRPRPTQGIPLVVLTVLWVIILLVAIGIPSNRWYLIGIGAIGMVQNTWAASSPRRPDLPFEAIGVVGSAGVACALAQLERFTMDGEAIGMGVGKNLVPVFFPSGLNTHHRELFGATGVEKDHGKEEYCDCGRASSASAASSLSMAIPTLA